MHLPRQETGREKPPIRARTRNCLQSCETSQTTEQLLRTSTRNRSATVRTHRTHDLSLPRWSCLSFWILDFGDALARHLNSPFGAIHFGFAASASSMWFGKCYKKKKYKRQKHNSQAPGFHLHKYLVFPGHLSWVIPRHTSWSGLIWVIAWPPFLTCSKSYRRNSSTDSPPGASNNKSPLSGSCCRTMQTICPGGWNEAFNVIVTQE